MALSHSDTMVTARRNAATHLLGRAPRATNSIINGDYERTGMQCDGFEVYKKSAGQGDSRDRFLYFRNLRTIYKKQRSHTVYYFWWIPCGGTGYAGYVDPSRGPPPCLRLKKQRGSLSAQDT